MTALPWPPINRIPAVAPTIKQDNAIKDLTKLSRLELLDLKYRQLKLMANRPNLNRLPDKGKRIQEFYGRVMAELERRTNIDEAANIFSELNIAGKGQDVLNTLEWNGRLKDVESHDYLEDVLDSDDEDDPLRVIAQRTMHERRTKVLPHELNLITENDLAEIASFKKVPKDNTSNKDATNCHGALLTENENGELETGSNLVDAQVVEIDVSEKLPNIRKKMQHILEKLPLPKTNSISDGGDSRCSTPSVSDGMDQHVRYLVEKAELQVAPLREKYKPYKTTVSDVHDPAKERNRKKGKHWEVTAATPPFIQHSGAKMLTLLDSVELQANYLGKMKELQEKQAEERLAARLERLHQRNLRLTIENELKTRAAFTAYRTPGVHIEGEQKLNEDEEVHDPLDEEKAGGGVTYTIYN